jgi:hypothetical protein
MLNRLAAVVAMFAGSISVLAQTRVYESPHKELEALIISVGRKGYESYESQVEIRTSRGSLLVRRSFASQDHDHGEGVGHAEWTSDGQFFVFNTFSSGGHQPWHAATYFYRVRDHKIYSLDAFAGSITSDFALEGRNTIVTTRFDFDKNKEKETVRVTLGSLITRRGERRGVSPERGQRLLLIAAPAQFGS